MTRRCKLLQRSTGKKLWNHLNKNQTFEDKGCQVSNEEMDKIKQNQIFELNKVINKYKLNDKKLNKQIKEMEEDHSIVLGRLSKQMNQVRELTTELSDAHKRIFELEDNEEQNK